MRVKTGIAEGEKVPMTRITKSIKQVSDVHQWKWVIGTILVHAAGIIAILPEWGHLTQPATIGGIVAIVGAALLGKTPISMR
jgi:hypothetical protein